MFHLPLVARDCNPDVFHLTIGIVGIRWKQKTQDNPNSIAKIASVAAEINLFNFLDNVRAHTSRKAGVRVRSGVTAHRRKRERDIREGIRVEFVSHPDGFARVVGLRCAHIEEELETQVQQMQSIFEQDVRSWDFSLARDLQNQLAFKLYYVEKKRVLILWWMLVHDARPDVHLQNLHEMKRHVKALSIIAQTDLNDEEEELLDDEKQNVLSV